MPMPSIVVLRDEGSSSVSDARTILATRPKVKVRFVVAQDCSPQRRADIRRLLTSAAPESRWTITTTEDAP